MECKRKINRIILHCSATQEGKDFNAKDIDRWHRERGWSGIGYHYVIKLDGTIEVGRDIIKIGSHCKGYNKDSIGICYIGGLDKEGNPKDTRTIQQKASMSLLIERLRKRFSGVKLYAHCDFATVNCPCIPTLHEEYGW
jgi:N-acetylmuramoyl-L-alanine amidase